MNLEVLGRPQRSRMYLIEIQIARAVTLIQEGYSRHRTAELLNTINRGWITHENFEIFRRQHYPGQARASTVREQLLAIRERQSTVVTLQNNELVEYE